MRLVSVPGRTVRHWVTRRVIDAAGILYDPFCTTAAHYLAAGDLVLVDDVAEPAPAPEPADTADENPPISE
jgi:hypothetical protein